MAEVKIGTVNHYYDRISVAVVDLTGPLRLGDTVAFSGKHTYFGQQVTSMQIDHKEIEAAQAGQEVAIKVVDRVRAGDTISRVE